MIVDLAIVGFTGFFVWRGFRRGLVLSLAGLAGFVAAAAAAVFGYRALARPLEEAGASEGVANIGGALAIFVAVSALAWAGGRALTRLLDWTKWGLVNKAGGAALAAGWALAWVTVVLLGMSVAPSQAVQGRVESSALARGIVREAPRFAVTVARSDLRRLVTSVWGEPERKVAITATLDFRPVEVAARELFDRVNAERRGRTLPELRWDDGLAAEARAHAADMYRRGYFGHETPDGLGPAARLRARGVVFHLVGENIALAATVADAHAQLMASARHRRTILGRGFTRVGVGVMFGAQGYLITQEFAG